MTDLRHAQSQLQEVQAAVEAALSEPVAETALQAGTDPAQAGGEKPKKSGSAKGVDTLFRSAYRVQMDLTGLADNKANMMISINGIIMSIMIASVAPKLDANPWLLVPTSVLLMGSLVSMVYAILAARPRVSSTPITLSDLKNSKGNILFFGNFANLAQDDFVEGMDEMMEDPKLVYDTMIRNIHGLGSVLSKKFALLQIAYTSFMVALIAGVASFLGVFIWIMQRSP